jgi:hypothetical protein
LGLGVVPLKALSSYVLCSEGANTFLQCRRALSICGQSSKPHPVVVWPSSPRPGGRHHQGRYLARQSHKDNGSERSRNGRIGKGQSHFEAIESSAWSGSRSRYGWRRSSVLATRRTRSADTVCIQQRASPRCPVLDGSLCYLNRQRGGDVVVYDCSLIPPGNHLFPSLTPPLLVCPSSSRGTPWT